MFCCVFQDFSSRLPSYSYQSKTICMRLERNSNLKRFLIIIFLMSSMRVVQAPFVDWIGKRVLL